MTDLIAHPVAEPVSAPSHKTGSRTAKLEGVEAGRGVAALLVALLHIGHHIQYEYGQAPFGGIFEFGHAGVDFFFVLSGFIILTVHFAERNRREAFPAYLGKRFSRVFPLYWVVLLFTIAVASQSRNTPLPTVGEFLKSIVLIPYEGGPYFGPAWTLQHEILFYTVFSIFFFNARRARDLCVIWAVLILIGPLLNPSDAWLKVLLSPFNLEFLFGMSAALILIQRRVPLPKAVLLSGLFMFFGTGALELTHVVDGHGTLARFLYGGASMFALLGAVECERSGFLPVPGFFRRLGTASYSLYLTHVPSSGVCFKIFRVTHMDSVVPPLAQFIVAMCVAVATAILVSQFVEYPLLRFCRSQLRRRGMG